MGFGRIISGGEDGRYTIELDFGEATRQGLLSSITAVIARIDIATAEVQAKLIEAEAQEAMLVAQVQAAEAQLIAETGPGRPAGSQGADTAAFRFALQQLTRLRAQNEPLRLRLQSLQHERSVAVKRYAQWAAFNPVERRGAWCVDFTEDAPAGSYVATLEIPGESALILVAPGARPWTQQDGILTAREIMSPEQAFLNAAILPGWQKFKPTYRWGTIASMDAEAETCTVTLASAVSSAQSLAVNQTTTLRDVPIEYMECGASVFEVGDRVVVQFIGQNWATPKVVGFLDNPRPCNWQCIHLEGPLYFFESRDADVMDAIFSGAAVFEYRLNSSAWATHADDPDAASTTSVIAKATRFFRTPSETEPLGLISTQVFRYAAGDRPPRITVQVSPSGPFPPPRPTESRNIAEIRIRIAGKTVFNVAIRDMGWLGEGVTVGYAKTPGGINLRGFIGSSGTEVLALGYTLTGRDA